MYDLRHSASFVGCECDEILEGLSFVAEFSLSATHLLLATTFLYSRFLFSLLHFILYRKCVCHMFNKVLTYLRLITVYSYTWYLCPLVLLSVFGLLVSYLSVHGRDALCILLAYVGHHLLCFTIHLSYYTVNHKKRDILFLTITLANLHRFYSFYIILIVKKFYMWL